MHEKSVRTYVILKEEEEEKSLRAPQVGMAFDTARSAQTAHAPGQLAYAWTAVQFR
jgi:hypothetical protein